MHSIWKGSITFGLVNIPVAVYAAVRKEQLKFRLLRKADLSPVNYKRVAELDGEEVPWEQIVRGYEYENGHFVLIEDQDLKQIDLNVPQTIQILDFVSLDEIDPVFFDKPYYLEPQKGAGHAYSLLRDVMTESGASGIAKVVLRSRQHLAALEPRDKFLVLHLMHFADEVLQPEELKVPQEARVAKQEFELAKALVGKMTTKWDPAKYTDDYKSGLSALIEKKVREGEKQSKARRATTPPATNVVNMVEMLEKSLFATGSGKRRRSRSKKHKAAA
jgi:DNA end-binding protein Ku